MQKILKNERLLNILIPVIAVLFGLLAGALIMIISNYNPIEGFSALINGVIGDSYFMGETVRSMTPLILAGIAVAFAFRTGLFNIGVEGQLIVGWLASVYVGIAFELPKIIHIPVAILAAGLAGALWGFIPGLLKAKFKVHEVITTIMMNYIALHVSNSIIRTFLLQPGERTDRIQTSASLQSDFLRSLTDFSRLHYGILIAILGAAVMWFLLEKTAKGYELRAVGFNQHASQYAGMNVSRNVMLSFAISGAFAGIGGAMEGLGTYGYMTIMGGFTGVGFDGIAVALLGANTALGVVFASALFGSLKVGALNMQSIAGVPTELVEIVIALIIFFVAANYLIRILLARLNKEGK